MTKALILETDANILLVSQFIKVTPEVNYVYELIKKHKSVSQNLVPDKIQREKIQRNLNQWIHASLLEWRIDNSVSPHNLTAEEKKENIRCAFCNSRLSSIAYYADNVRNHSRIALGSDCVRKLGDPEFMASAFIAKNSSEQKRYEHIKAKNPQLDRIMTYGRNRISNLEYILSLDLITRFRSSFDKLKKSIERYNRTGLYTGKAKNISQNINEYEDIWKAIIKFQKNAKENSAYYLSKDTIENEERLDEKETDLIIEAVKNNDGLINTNISANIKNFPFLTDVARLYRGNSGLRDLNITAENDGIFNLKLNIEDTAWVFYLSSDHLIRQVGFPKFKNNVDTKNIIKKFGKDFIPDYQTKQKLILKAENILKQFNIHRLLLSSNNIWKNDSDSKEDWLSKNYGKKYLYIDANGNIVELKENFIVNLARFSIFNFDSPEELRDKVNKVLINTITKDKLYKNIRNDFEVADSFRHSVQ